MQGVLFLMRPTEPTNTSVFFPYGHRFGKILPLKKRSPQGPQIYEFPKKMQGVLFLMRPTKPTNTSVFFPYGHRFGKNIAFQKAEQRMVLSVNIIILIPYLT